MAETQLLEIGILTDNKKLKKVPLRATEVIDSRGVILEDFMGKAITVDDVPNLELPSHTHTRDQITNFLHVHDISEIININTIKAPIIGEILQNLSDNTDEITSKVTKIIFDLINDGSDIEIINLINLIRDELLQRITDNIDGITTDITYQIIQQLNGNEEMIKNFITEDAIKEIIDNITSHITQEILNEILTKIIDKSEDVVAIIKEIIYNIDLDEINAAHKDHLHDDRYSQLGHNHEISDTNNLQESLDGKEPKQTPALRYEAMSGSEPGIRSWSPARIKDAILALSPTAGEIPAATPGYLATHSGIAGTFGTPVNPNTFAPANISIAAETSFTTNITTPALGPDHITNIIQSIWRKVREVANVIGTKQTLVPASVNGYLVTHSGSAGTFGTPVSSLTWQKTQVPGSIENYLLTTSGSNGVFGSPIPQSTFASAAQGVLADNAEPRIFVGISSNHISNVLKTASIPGFVLSNNVKVIITFTNGNNVENPTLNVSGTGPKAIMYNGKPVTTVMIPPEHIGHFVYDGYFWHLLNPYVKTADEEINLALNNAISAGKLGRVRISTGVAGLIDEITNSVGSNQLPMYLKDGIPTAITRDDLRVGIFGVSPIGSQYLPVYIDAYGTPTALTQNGMRIGLFGYAAIGTEFQPIFIDQNGVPRPGRPIPDISGLAPIDHAVDDMTYGVATQTKFGHIQVTTSTINDRATTISNRPKDNMAVGYRHYINGVQDFNNYRSPGEYNFNVDPFTITNGFKPRQGNVIGCNLKVFQQNGADEVTQLCWPRVTGSNDANYTEQWMRSSTGPSSWRPWKRVGMAFEIGKLADIIVGFDDTCDFDVTGKTESETLSMLNAAVTATPPGGKLFFKSGTYNINNTLVIDNKKIHIEGMAGNNDTNTSRIIEKATTTCISIVGESSVSITHMSINGTNNLQGGINSSITIATTNATNFSFCTISHCFIGGSCIGISINSPRHIITNNILGNLDQGIVLSSNKSIISNNIFHMINSNGIRTISTGDFNTITSNSFGESNMDIQSGSEGNIISNNTGIHRLVLDNNSQKNLVIGNIVQDWITDGTTNLGTSNVIFKNWVNGNIWDIR